MYHHKPPPFYNAQIEARRAEIMCELEDRKNAILAELGGGNYDEKIERLTNFYLEYMANMTLKVSECQRQVDKIIENALQALVNASVGGGAVSALHIVDENGDTYAIYIKEGKLRMRREVSE